MTTYVKAAVNSYANTDEMYAAPVASLQGRNVSPIRRFEGKKGHYLIFHNPTREVSKWLFEQEGYELPLPPGKESLEGYVLGRGAFGAFYLAAELEEITDKVCKYVGIKITEGRGPIEAEVAIQEALSGLKYIMPSLDKQIVDKGGRKLLQVMPLAGLGSLEAIAPIIRFQKDKLFQERLLFVIAHDLLHGLVAMHSRGFYHLDLKPGNIVLNKQGEGTLIDFGCTVKVENGLIDAKITNGDTEYFSAQRWLHYREARQGMLKGAAIDVWAAGLSLLELAAGFPYSYLHARSSAEAGSDALRQFFNENLYSKLTSSIPDSFESFILQLLPFDENRAPSAEQAMMHPWFQKMERASSEWEKEIRLHLVEMIQSLRRKKRGDLSMQDLPPPHLSDYLSRSQLESRLIERLMEPVGEKAPQTVIQGMGGLGKTQLTTYLVNHPAIVSNFPVILWLRSADEPSQITTQIHSYAREQGLIDEKATTEEAVQAFHGYLSRIQKPWLLVVDNADDPPLIKPYLPPKGGHILISSRSTDWEDVMPLPPFSLDEGKVLIAKLLEKSSSEDAALCQELGLLPLALVQACAYIRSQGLTTAQYMEELKTAPSLLYQNTELFGKELPKAVGALWQITLKKLEGSAPESLRLLNQLTYLSPEGIPPALLNSLADSSVQEPLIRYALIQRSGETFSMHRLLQKVVQSSHSPQQKEELLPQLFSALKKLYIFENATNEQSSLNRLLLSHGEALLAIKLDSLLAHRAWTLSWVAKEYDALGEPPKALSFHQEAIGLAKTTWGEKHEEYAHILHYLAECLLSLRRYDEAVGFIQQSLEIRQAKLGPDHPDVATSLNNLGDAFDSQGKYAEAIDYHTQALEIRQAKLGPDHPHVADSLNNLGAAFCSQGKYDEVIDYYTQALKIYQAKLGPDHPHVATSLNNLGLALKAQGKYKKAINYYTQALKIRQAKLGPDHPHVADSLSCLGVALKAQGKYQEAIDYYTQALEIWQAKLGPDHPDVVSSLNNLGNAFNSQGKYAEAIDYYTQALEIRQAKLGPDHLFTLSTQGNLKSAQQEQGNKK